MKKIVCCVIILFTIQFAFGQQDKVVESKISHVTVFLNKAQISRKVKTRIQEGATNLIIPGLTAQLDPNSIQVSGKGNFILLGINHKQNFLNELTTPTRVRILNDSIEDLQDLIALETTQKQILEKEENMLLTNQKIGGSSQNLPVNELKEMADFFRTRLYDIAIARLKHDKQIASLSQKLLKLQQQVRIENDIAVRNTSEIIVSLSARAGTEVEIDLDYVVGNAGWAPMYDVRGVNTSSPLTLFYKANVFQNTGEHWNNVKLKLSTANPALGGVKPDLQPWHLDFYQPDAYLRKQRKAAAPATGAPTQALSEVVVTSEDETIADFVSVVQTSLNTEFEITLPYTVNSASKPVTVDIGKHELPATYRYSVAPKLDMDAFLMAGATGWADFNLLPGEANVFFGGTFVGKTFIDPRSVKDTLSVSLGRDKRIVVKRQKVKDFNSQAIIGLNQRESYAFEIDIRNNQSDGITIEIEDHIPVSDNNQIEVTLLKDGGAQFTPGTGKLAWEVNLKSNESKKIVYQFEVRFPKDKRIAGLN